ncbi:MAG: NAD-dependent protein deacetylase [Bacteroidetes bacterium]|jgi:NAD-dependent SIR2 family protein deacetylase|nr:NAD-dependent protein deacetylase [Bacteroidota bacterium]
MAVTPNSFSALVGLLRGRRIVVLSGAGCSTESGIPDYRGPETRHKARNPIRYRAFRDDPQARQRYWARSALGWPRFRVAEPNHGHRALAALEAVGQVAGIITQNVDGLHQAAGSRTVVELHGALHEVACLQCQALTPRQRLQEQLLMLNPGWQRADVALAPDGDAEVDDARIRSFRVPPCGRCGGVLKPNVVFFGENVPAPRVADAWALFDAAEALLVVGSSLTVYSGYRFVRRAAERGIPIGMVNLGPTRGDADAAVRVEARCGTVLPSLAGRLTAFRQAG